MLTTKPSRRIIAEPLPQPVQAPDPEAPQPRATPQTPETPPPEPVRTS